MTCKKVKRWLLLSVALLLLLTGCRKDTVPTVTDNYESELVYGVFEAEKLQVLPWNSGRCEKTTANKMIETENGYYYLYDGMHLLHYADKTDLSYWALVCNKPTCYHYKRTSYGYEFDMSCNAYINGQWIIMRNGRIYHTEPSGTFELPVVLKGIGNIIVSTAMDGTDKRFEYVIEEAVMGSMGGITDGRLIGDQWIQSKSEIDLYGNTASRMFVLDADGEREIDIPKDKQISLYPSHIFYLWGDAYFECDALSKTKWLRFQGEELVGFEKKYVPDTGGYISGTTLRIFQENRGYFDIDVTTGQRVKVEDNRIKNSTGFILAANCVIESNAFGVTYKNRSGPVQIEVFDGEIWRSVTLPAEWENLGTERALHVLGITSDSILLCLQEKTPADTRSLYRIPLGEEELTLEYCFDFPQKAMK